MTLLRTFVIIPHMTMENDFLKPKKDSSVSEVGVKNNIEILKKRYVAIGETFAMIVREILNLSVPEKTLEEWRVLSFSTRIIDNTLDNITDPTERLGFSKKIISFLRGNMADFSTDEDLEKAILDVKNLYASLEENKGEFFIDSLSRILKITEKIKIEENPRKIVTLTRIEGQIAARFYLSFLPQEFKLSDKYRQLVHALTRLGRAANSFDSFIDLPDDFENKQVQIKPTILNRTLFLGAALSDGLSLLKDTGSSKDLIIRFLKATKHVAQSAPKKLK